MKTLLVLFLSISTATAAHAADSTSKKVDQLFAAFDKPGSPGCSVGVIRNGNLIYKKAFGYASLELGAPLTPESVFYVASVSKQFTAASLVIMDARPGSATKSRFGTFWMTISSTSAPRT